MITNIILIGLTLIIGLAAMLLGLFFIWYSLITLFRKQAPFVPLPKAVIPKVLQALQIKDNNIVYDLGCGDGRILIAAWQKNPKACYFGIEKSFLPRFLASWHLRKIYRPQNISIVKGDFCKKNLSGATHIFTYLFPEIMNQLLPKLQAELQPGACLISCDFPFKNKPASKIIDLKRRPRDLGHKLYIYYF